METQSERERFRQLILVYILSGLLFGSNKSFWNELLATYPSTNGSCFEPSSTFTCRTDLVSDTGSSSRRRSSFVSTSSIMIQGSHSSMNCWSPWCVLDCPSLNKAKPCSSLYLSSDFLSTNSISFSPTPYSGDPECPASKVITRLILFLHNLCEFYSEKRLLVRFPNHRP